MSEEVSIMELSSSREALSATGNESSMEVERSNRSSTSGSSGDAKPATTAPSAPAGDVPMEFPPLGPLKIESEGSFVWHFRPSSSVPAQGSGGEGEVPNKKVYSDSFRAGKHSWKLLLYPTGNEPYEGQCLSLYLAMEAPSASGEDDDWYCCAQLILSIEHPSGKGPILSKYTQHRFDASESDWGFGSFCTLRTLTQGDPALTGGRPLIDGEDGSFIVRVRVRVIRDPTGILWHNFINYNSKRVTGFVGLANQGATCYMNSLLQSLYFTNAFRQAIFQIPTEGERPIDNCALALQRIFWRLQHDEHAASTNELTRAFGWETLESFIQSDVQEFSRVLLDELEGKMKGTPAEGSIERLFVGKVRNVIRCLHVPFESKRTESFYDLQLAVKGVRILEESFEAYVKAEMLEGDNKYAAEGYGLQDAKRIVEFEQLPPVLHLHLERYAFDPRVMATVKINDRLEFPLRINLNRYLAVDSPQQGQDQTFILQSVFVHSGDSHGGHYYVYMRDLTRPIESDDNLIDDGEALGDRYRWYKFDDTKVIPATRREAVEDNFGGLSEDEMTGSGNNTMASDTGVTTRSMSNASRGSRLADKYRKFTNAYMLVYIREADLSTVLCPISELPAHIGEAIRTEDESERRRRAEKQAALLNLKVHVITEENLGAHSGYDFYNLDNKNCPLSTPLTLKLPRTESLAELKKRVAREMDTVPEKIRFWTFHPRRNKTVRLDEPIAGEEERQPLSYFYHRLPGNSVSATASNIPFVLYAERLPTEGPLPPRDALCISFKFYDPEHATLKFVGKHYVSSGSNLDQLYPILRETVGLPKNVPLDAYEEIKPGRIDLINPSKTFAENQLQTGDIICFQISSPILTESVKWPKVTDYFRMLSESLQVRFRLATTGEDLVISRLSLRTPWADIIQAVAEKIGSPPSHVRLHVSPNADITSMEDTQPVRTAPTLHEALTPIFPEDASTEGVTLWAECTPLPVAELETMKRIHLQLLSYNERSDSDESMDVATPLPATTVPVYVGLKDTAASIADRLPTEWQALAPYRLLEVHHHRIIREYLGNDSLATLSETAEVYLEGPLPASELDPNATMISVFSYWKEPSRTHSMPLRLSLISGEPFALTKERIERRLGVTSTATAGWSFSLVSHGKARVIPDEAILTSLVSPTTVSEQLGINRPDPQAGNKISSTAPGGGIEKSIKIRSSTPKPTTNK